MNDTPRTDQLMQAKFLEFGSLGPHNCPEWLVVHARQLERELAKLRSASQAHLDRYVALVNSGDAGNWNPEDEDHVINLRRALKK